MEEENLPIRVMVIDDHPLFRAGVVAVLGQHADIRVVGEAGDGNEAVRLFREQRPDVVLMDLRMPSMGGVEATSLIVSEFPGARVLVLTTYEGDVEALRALKAGATGYMLKNCVLDQLPLAIRNMMSGFPFEPGADSPPAVEPALHEPLTAREIEVLKLVAAGHSNKLAARQLAISEETIKSHMKGIIYKLQARDRTHAVSIAIRRGIIVG